MTALVYEVPATAGMCELTDPQGTTQRIPILELSSQAGRIDCALQFQENEYIDIGLLLGDQVQENLFAQVISSGDELLVRWLHFDPSEESRLREVLAGYFKQKGVSGSEGDLIANRKRESRRIARPRRIDQDGGGERYKRQSSAITPFQDAGAGGQTPAGGKRTTRKVVRPRGATPSDGEDESSSLRPATAPQGKAGDGSSRIKRVTRPRLKPAGSSPEPSPQPAADALTPAGGAAAIGEESGNRHVVIEPTERFKKLAESDASSADKPASESGRRPAVGQSSSGKHTAVFTKDGKIDVGSTLKNRAKTIRASDLAARHDKVRVLNMSTIKELIQAAVQEAVERLGGSIDQKERERLLKEAEDNFQEQIKAFQAEKKGWEEKAASLEEQLSRAQRLLEEERAKEIKADQFTVSEAGMEDLEKRFDRLVERAISANSVNDVLADELRAMVGHVLDSEREHIAEQAKQAQNHAIAMLKKKITRLASSLEETEKERDLHRRRAAALDAGGGGIAGIMEAGLAEDDPDRERKMSLLKTVFEQNQEMRQALKDQGIDLPQRKRPKPPPVDAAVDADAAAPVEPGSAAPEAASLDEAVEADVAVAPVAAAAAEAVDPTAEDDDPYASMGNPDDEVWQPGMSFSTDVAGDDEDPEDRSVKKITDFAAFEPPPLAGAGEGSGIDQQAVAGGDVAADDDDLYGDLGDPDDEIWEPGMSFATDVPGDNEGDDGDDAVKKIEQFDNFEPPPLERSG